MTRYQELADDIEASITAGVLCPGDKLPSVRQTSERRGVSASTVFQAYYLLEARGLVRARERSGYFVAQRDRKSTRLNSSHSQISYAVFCLKKKKTKSNSNATART